MVEDEARRAADQEGIDEEVAILTSEDGDHSSGHDQPGEQGGAAPDPDVPPLPLQERPPAVPPEEPGKAPAFVEWLAGREVEPALGEELCPASLGQERALGSHPRREVETHSRADTTERLDELCRRLSGFEEDLERRFETLLDREARLAEVEQALAVHAVELLARQSEAASHLATDVRESLYRLTKLQESLVRSAAELRELVSGSGPADETRTESRTSPLEPSIRGQGPSPEWPAQSIPLGAADRSAASPPGDAASHVATVDHRAEKKGEPESFAARPSAPAAPAQPASVIPPDERAPEPRLEGSSSTYVPPWSWRVRFGGSPLLPMVRLRAKRRVSAALGADGVRDAPNGSDLWLAGLAAAGDVALVRSILDETLADTGARADLQPIDDADEACGDRRAM